MAVAVAVGVFAGVCVGVLVGIFVGVDVFVAVGVLVGVRVGVDVFVGGNGVLVIVGVYVRVGALVWVGVFVGVAEGPGVGVTVGTGGSRGYDTSMLPVNAGTSTRLLCIKPPWSVNREKYVGISVKPAKLVSKLVVTGLYTLVTICEVYAARTYWQA